MMAMAGLLYVIDVQVQQDGRVLVIGSDESSRAVALVVTNFEFLTYYEIDDQSFADLEGVRRAIRENTDCDISTCDFVTAPRFNFYECDLDGNRLHGKFLRIGTKDIKSWKIVSGKKSCQIPGSRAARLAEDRPNITFYLADLLVETTGVTLRGSVKDGVEPKSDGRTCNAREGSSVSLLAHQFLRRTGLRCCEWCQYEGDVIDYAERTRFTDERFQEIEVHVDKLLPYTGESKQPRVKIASWDIECLNTLALDIDATTIADPSVFCFNKYACREDERNGTSTEATPLEQDSGVQTRLPFGKVQRASSGAANTYEAPPVFMFQRASALPREVEDVFCKHLNVKESEKSSENKGEKKKKLWHQVFKMNAQEARPCVRVEFESLTDMKKRPPKSCPRSVEFFYMYEDNASSVRCIKAFPGESVVFQAGHIKTLWVALKKCDGAEHFDLQFAKQHLMCYFREFDEFINRQTVRQLQYIFSQSSGCVHPRAGRLSLVVRSPDGTTLGLDDLPDYSTIGENWTFECLDGDKKVVYSEVLRFNEIPSASCPFNEVVAISWNESVYSSGKCEEIHDSCIYQMCRIGAGGKRLPYGQAGERNYDDIPASDETGLLERFCDVQQKSQAILALGYNTSGFDVPYVFRRMCERMVPSTVRQLYTNALGFHKHRSPNDFPLLMPSVRSTESSGMGQSESWSLPGLRFYVDLYTWFRVHFPPKTSEGDAVSLKLNSVSEFYLKNKKLDVCFKQVNRMWRDASAGSFHRHVVDYCVQDSRLVTDLAICSAVSLIEYNLRLSSVMNVLLRLMPMNNVGQMARLEPYVQHAAFERNIIVNQALRENVMMANSTIDKQYQGGMVLPPKAGEHGRWIPELRVYDWAYSVFALDFKSLYPSVMRAFNICWHSMIRPGYECAQMNECEEGLKIVFTENVHITNKSIDNPRTPEITIACCASPYFSEARSSFVEGHSGQAGFIKVEYTDDLDIQWFYKKLEIQFEKFPFQVYGRCDPNTGRLISNELDDPRFFISVYCIVPASLKLLISEEESLRLVSVFVQKTDESKEGVLPERLKKMNNLRAEVRRKAKTLPPELQASAQAEQLAIKVCANAQYGMIAPAHMNPMIRMAAAVTCNSRKMLMRARNRALNDGFEVIYGDTDSIFVRMLPPLRRRVVREILTHNCDVPAHTEDADLDHYEDIFDTLEGKTRAYEAVRDGLHEFISNHADSQTKDFEDPNELEFENVFLKSEFFQDSKKCYVALATENTSSTPKMYYKGVTCRKSDCIELSREIQRVCYMAKCNPMELTKVYPDLVLDDDPFVTARSLISRIMAPLLQSRSTNDDQFYEWCASRLVQRKVYKRESSYSNPDAMPHVMAHRGVEKYCPTMACAIGDSQSFLVCKNASGRACDGAVDPRIFAIQKMRKLLDKVYYIHAVWKGLKGDVTVQKKGSVLKPGRMNLNTFENLQPLFIKLIRKAMGMTTLFEQVQKHGTDLVHVSDVERAKARADFENFKATYKRKSEEQ